MALTKVGKEGITGISNSSDATAITIDSSERVLIGTTTAHTADSLLTMQNSSGVAELNITSGTSGASLINMGDTGDYNIGRIKYDQSNDSMQFNTNNTERMRIDSTGKATFNNHVVVNDRVVGDNDLVLVTTDSNEKIHMDSDGFIKVETAGSERLRVDSSGKVYIGRTSDPFMSTGSVKRLSIDGGTTSTDSTIVSNKNSASTMFHFYFHNSNSVIGSISTNAHATSFNTSSDHRLKENVADITGAIARVKSLQPKRFNWITEPDTTIDGFLAHEAATVVPESVTGSHNETRAATGIVKAADGKVLAENVEQKDWTANKGDDEGDMYPSSSTWTASEDLPVYQTIDQAKLVPLLTAALKESIAKIETLETQRADLEARLTALETA